MAINGLSIHNKLCTIAILETLLLDFYIMTLPSGYVGQKVLRDICLEAQLNEEECDDYVGMVFR